MIREILDKMLIIYYTFNIKQPSKIIISFNLKKALESEFNAISNWEYVTYLKYKGIPLEFSIKEAFISLQK